MRIRIILMVLPALACAKIRVHIEASSAKDKTSATFNGTDSNVISDIEIESFNLTTSNLKAAVSALAKGTPLDVFLKSLTPWGDLYKTYNWSEVRRNTKVISVRVANVRTEAVTLDKKSYENKIATSEILCEAALKVDVENYLKNNFTGKRMSVEPEYDVNLLLNVHLPMNLKLLSHLGMKRYVKNALKIKAEKIFALKSLQAAEFILNATKVNFDVLVDYESNLSGDVAVNYNPKYLGHHFWAYDVNAVIKSVTDMTAVQKGTDLVSIEFFTNAFGYVADQYTGKTIAKVPGEYIF